jgi:hypothetical protein
MLGSALSYRALTILRWLDVSELVEDVYCGSDVVPEGRTTVGASGHVFDYAYIDFGKDVTVLTFGL